MATSGSATCCDGGDESICDGGDESISRGVRNLDIDSDLQGGFVRGEYHIDVMPKLGETLSYVDCKECSYVHPPGANHRNWKCRICFNLHYPGDCPYVVGSIPQNAPYDKRLYEIKCKCGDYFNEDKWMCSRCGGHWAVLRRKHCLICHGLDHGDHECPKDKDMAARFKAFADMMRSRVPNSDRDGSRVPFFPDGVPSYTPSSIEYSS